MAENAPPAAHNTWYNENQGRSIGKNGHGVVKISGIAGSSCSYTLGTTSSFTVGASSSVTVGAALSATIGAQLGYTAAVSFTCASSATVALTYGSAVSYNYSTSYSYRKGKTYSMDETEKTDLASKSYWFSKKIVEAHEEKTTNSKKETKTATEKYTVNTQTYELNIDSTETKSVISTSSEAVQGNKTITSQQELNLAAVSGVSIGTAAAFMQISTTGLKQTGAADLGNPPASSLAGLLTAAAAQIQTARIALITAKTAAVATQDAAYLVYEAAQKAAQATTTLDKADWLAAPV